MNAAAIQRFIRGGNATFTIQSVESGAHFTYNVRRAAQGVRGNFLFVKVLVAPDVYAYLGALSLGRLITTRASRISESAPSFKALSWFMRELARTAPDAAPAKVLFRHEGRCARCGRPLTTPASCDTGFGPDCAEMLGIAHETRPPVEVPLRQPSRARGFTPPTRPAEPQPRGLLSLQSILAASRAEMSGDHAADAPEQERELHEEIAAYRARYGDYA